MTEFLTTVVRVVRGMRIFLPAHSCQADRPGGCPKCGGGAGR